MAIPQAPLVRPPPALPTPPGVPDDEMRLRAIEESHARCRALGLSESAAPELNPASARSLKESRERHRRLHEQAAPVMEMLFEQIVYTRSIVVLTDHHGTILHALGDDGFLERAQQVALAPGVNWSEATKGTNAIGTALFDATPTLVHGREHFVRANHFLTCSASPIFDHAGGLLGVLDVTGDQRSYHPHTLAMVRMSARMIENQWFADRFRHGLRLHFHSRPELLGTMREAMVALSPEGRILGANRSALEQLALSAGTLRMLGIEAVLGVSVGHIADHCRRHGDEPMKLALAHGDRAGLPVVARASFAWPAQWAGAVPAPAVEALQRQTAGAAAEVAGGAEVIARSTAHEPATDAGATDPVDAPSRAGPATGAHAALPSMGSSAGERRTAPAPRAATAHTGTDAQAVHDEAAAHGTLREVEADTVRRAVDAAGGNISRAARQLGVGRNTVYRKLRDSGAPAARLADSAGRAE
jgi:transcriptional regulator of acetoin/glycerol metabolism